MPKHLIMVHGRNFKPDKGQLEPNWTKALRYGIARDHGDEKANQFDAATKEMAYFGDLSNEFLRASGREYDMEADVHDRQLALTQLEAYSEEDFLSKKTYQDLPGCNAWKEALADTLGELLEFFHLGKPVISLVVPDMAAYWDSETDFGSNLRSRLTDPLFKALDENKDVLLIAHSLGSLIAYDVLWKLSHYGEHVKIRAKKLSLFVTIGSPLGDETSKRHLKGASATRAKRYPHNIKRWINIAAEDDYIAHDEKIANDYRNMERLKLVESISDHRIYNLSVREGNSNPHHGAGYLIHPKVASIVADWLD